MLNILGVLIFMIPLSFSHWGFVQTSFLLLSVLFIMNLGSFNFLEGCGAGLGLDLMSYMLILLSIWVCMLMILSSEYIMSSNFFDKIFILNVLMMTVFLILSFSVLNIFMFYLFFESSLIPIFMMILGWGYQSERLQAGVYMLLYTLIGSLPLLIMIMYIYSTFSSLSFLSFKNLDFNYTWVMYLGICCAFLVKLPMFLLHFWLPKAHVEAPVAGSMILAGVLLKLGGYGLMRFLLILYKYNMKFNYYIIIMSLVGGVLISLNCLRQSDMKLLIAYSSVSHMGIMVGGMLTLNYWGLMSAMLMMLSHGLCSSGLFFLVNVKYERVGSRNLFLVKGMLHFLPKMSLWWFLFCAMNMAAPPSLNLLSEIGLINSLISWSSWSMICLSLMSFFAAGYSLYLFSFNQHGKYSVSLYSFYTSSMREYLILILHWVPLNFLILNSDLVVLWL